MTANILTHANMADTYRRLWPITSDWRSDSAHELRLAETLVMAAERPLCSPSTVHDCPTRVAWCLYCVKKVCKMAKLWSNDEIYKFIELYRNESVIWDPKHKYHKDKVKLIDAWDRLSAEMDMPVETLKKKKETLMAAFRLNYKKKMAHKSDDPLDDKGPAWVFYEPLAEFLGELYDNKVVNSSLDKGASSVICEEKWQLEGQSDEELQDDQPSAPKRHRSNSTEPNSNRSEKYINIMSSLAKLMNVISGEMIKIDQNKREEDECDIYGKLIAIRLREMPVNERRELMYEIDSLILQRCNNNDDL